MISFTGVTAEGSSAESDVTMFVFTVSHCGSEDEHPQINSRLAHITT
jgi:hypothetical protein